MLSFTNSSDSYDGEDRENRGVHDIVLNGYNNCVGGSPQARMKKILGDLIRPTGTGDDAHVPYGRALSVILHAALPGKELEAVPFLGNSPKDTALARILEEAVLGVDAEASNLTMSEWAKYCADLRQSTSLSDKSKQALTLNVTDFFSHEIWVPFNPAPGTGPEGSNLPPTAYLREPAAAAMLHLTWAGDLAFASSDSLAPTARLFGYTGGLITGAQRSAFGQADLVLCDLFVRLSQGKENSNPEEDAIEITEGWRNTQWPECMVTLPRLGPASAVDMKRMFDYSSNSTWQNFKTKSIAASASSPQMRALFPRETNPAKVEATLLQLAPQAKVSVTLPPHTILEAVSRLAHSHMGWLTRADVSTWPTEKIAAALLERLHGAGLATSQTGGQHASDDSSKQSAAGFGGKGGIAPSMQQRWMVCAASQEHNIQIPLLEQYLLRVDHDPVVALEMAFTGQYPVELLAECDTTTPAGVAKHAAMLVHNSARTPLCILHQICWGVVRAVIVLPTLNLLEQYATTHRSKMWGRVVARVYALDDGMPPKALRNLDLLALDKALAGKVGQAIDLTNMVDAVVVSIYNGVSVQPIPIQEVQGLMALLKDKSSPYALHWDDDEGMLLSVARLVTIIESDAPANTLRQEASNWRHWLAFCEQYRTSPWRKPMAHMSMDEADAENLIWAKALLFIHARMKPGRRSKTGQAKPASALAVIAGIRRAHKRMGRETIPLTLAAQLSHGMTRDFLAEYGPEALSIRRKEPYTNAMIRAMLTITEPVRVDSSCRMLGPRKTTWDTCSFFRGKN